MTPSAGRSVLSVVAGLVVLTVASFAIEAAIGALARPGAVEANAWGRAVTYSYGFLCVAAGGYVAGRLAGRSPLAHAAVVGIVQAALTVMAMLSPAVGGHASAAQWMVIALATIPAALLGGLACGRPPRDSGLPARQGVS